MIIADENVPSTIITDLRMHQFEVVSIFEEYRGISDLEIVNLALSKDKVILTEDKDFANIVFAYNLNCKVILLRYHFKETMQISENLINYLQRNPDMTNKFITIQKNKIRERVII